MERLADNIADLYELHGRPAAGNTLEEAVWLDEQALGYPLNLMCSLYYESSFDESFRKLTDDVPPNPDESHE